MPPSLSPQPVPRATQRRGNGATSGRAIVVRLLAGNDASLLERDGGLLSGRGIDRRAVSALLDDPRRHVALALAGGRIVGIAFASHRPRPQGAPELVIGDLTVARSHRGRGIGRRLLALLLARGHALGCSEATAEAGRDDAAMRRLCARLGGVERPEPTVRVSFPLG